MNKLKRFTVVAMLLAMAIVLNILESFTLFIPGVKLGFANIIILIMLYEFKPTEAFLVDILRIILVGILRGSFLSPTFLMALSGGMLSFFVMLLFSKIKLFSPIGVSVLGAISHATGQVLVAIVILGTQAVIYYLPWIGLFSVLTGVLSGFITKVYLSKSITKQFLN